MPYNSVVDRFHIKKLRSRISSRKVHYLREHVHFAFMSRVHLKLIEKLVVDFLLVTIELLSLSVTVELLLITVSSPEVYVNLLRNHIATSER